MHGTSLTELIEERLAEARDHHSGRSASTVHGGHEHSLRQTLIALAEGHVLGEHESPREATLQVLRGRVRVATAGDTWEGEASDFLVIPPERHDLSALTDCAVLLTVALHPGA
ncbi:cupin domain-containing protein [Nocardioides panaciterrulae]|uniref:Quercetin dioxygenase-like cupin family protein n=1 Tax=Nocardioides panaciterrulae TaxID=661492 RepID=A0A7Y9J9I7_9ACTN|nr:cupin domain-containing protein [Nocardioides panaciterrulae]NYD40645.1 quercetin dioxygenase-like cupin family protein [Nocardioides panaciterrulae]